MVCPQAANLGAAIKRRRQHSSHNSLPSSRNYRDDEVQVHERVCVVHGSLGDGAGLQVRGKSQLNLERQEPQHAGMGQGR